MSFIHIPEQHEDSIIMGLPTNYLGPVFMSLGAILTIFSLAVIIVLLFIQLDKLSKTRLNVQNAYDLNGLY